MKISFNCSHLLFLNLFMPHTDYINRLFLWVKIEPVQGLIRMDIRYKGDGSRFLFTK